jgi:ubiquinone/menaquinone biosynthesis C-methylase UbiE
MKPGSRMESSQNHSQFYSKAKYYDIAFNFKNVMEENQTLIDLFRQHNRYEPKSFLDIAAGPATNAIQMAKVGLASAALDFSREMVEYGLQKARQEKVQLNFIQADMKNFELSQKVDLAAIFMDSTSYLITNDDVITHLQSVARNLRDNGLYVLEMSHPRDVFSVGKSASTEWECEQDDIKVSVQWGKESDLFDPITQTTHVTAVIKYRSSAKSGEIIDQSLQRCFSFQEIDALVKASGCFEMIDVLGSLKPRIQFSNEKASWRMIPVLRKK